MSNYNDSEITEKTYNTLISLSSQREMMKSDLQASKAVEKELERRGMNLDEFDKDLNLLMEVISEQRYFTYDRLARNIADEMETVVLLADYFRRSQKDSEG